MTGGGGVRGAQAAGGVGAAIGSLVELLDRWAAEKPTATAYLFLSAGRLERSISYATLLSRASAVAHRLREESRPGDRALLLLPSGIDYIEGLLGCFLAGIVSVPLFPPGSKRGLERLAGIVADCEASIALTSQSVIDGLDDDIVAVAGLARLRWIAVDQIPDAGGVGLSVGSDETAILQYTSGSTRAPRGVMVSHRNLVENSALFQTGFVHGLGAVTGGWLPFHHDMGLIGVVLQALWLGGPCILMSPMDFLRRPLRWLQAISDYRIHTSGAPNFAYDLCVDRIAPEQRRTLDLSCWRVAFNGSEPVRAETLRRFAAAFAEAGFREQALCPAYGLAEATLYVTSSPATRPAAVVSVDLAAMQRGSMRVRSAQSTVHGDGGAAHMDRAGDGIDPRVARNLVGCGRPCSGLEVRIVEPESLEPLVPGQVGEIWVSHASVAGGYWNDPEASAATFGATLAAEPERTWLRTGDLGVLLDGELFVTGRIKDAIIIEGRNHYPHDLEATAVDSHAAVRNACVAFSTDDGRQERLTLLAEVDVRWNVRKQTAAQRSMPAQPFDAGEVAAAVRRAVAEEHDLRIHTLGLLRPAQILRTTSGKVRRAACRAAWLAGVLEQIEAPQAETSEARAPGGAASTAVIDDST